LPHDPASVLRHCAAGTLRRATRSLVRVYDARLARAGLTTTQFSLLRTLASRDEPVTLAGLAAEQAFERTSLLRALEPLRRQGLISYSDGPGRAKRVALTRRGVRKIAQATPHWTAAQEDFVARFGRSAWNALAGQLVAIVDVARDMATLEG